MPRSYVRSPIVTMLIVAALIGPACRVRRPREAVQPDSNALWLQGYGFNNPNPDRIRRGEPPLNFDGTPVGSESKWYDWLEFDFGKSGDAEDRNDNDNRPSREVIAIEPKLPAW